MARINDIKGIAAALASSFCSSTNYNYLKAVMLNSEKGSFEIDLLSGACSDLAVQDEEVFSRFKWWLISQINKIGFETRSMESAKIKIDFKKIKSSWYFDCEAKIKIKGRDFSAKSRSSFS